ncbi:UDP-glucuronosyltransferase 2B33-like [Belonocnema kinseyi]|uniref:UDP-glucuronosyltransferase 2B33-like n=1 Tax=Belonocnema kinseyi TaxID=2817044 RepID=UPI00143D86C9|nr:UDP-glucuronosyltransferase 2B33-like [Belonocnema kinseyi]
MTVVPAFIVILINLSALEGFRILGICPSTSYSHQQPFQALMKALASRGHQVTVISPVPLKKPTKNYVDVDVSFTYRTKDCTKLRFIDAFSILKENMDESNKLCEEQISSTAVQKLISGKETFDVMIIEQLWFQCYYALVKRYNFPVLIGFLSVGNLPYAMDSVGNPDDPLLNPDMAYSFSDKMSLVEKFWNVVYTTWTRLYHKFVHLPRAQKIAEKISPGTSVFEIDRNFSLVILGNNHIFGYPKPLLPNIIEVHSLQIGDHPGNLPQEIQEFLDNANEGTIYFSLGSNLQTSQLPTGALTALCDALSSVKQRVLWKHSEILSVQSKNIKFVKWVPQQAVLAHTNTKVYMMQGGLQSMQEAVHYGVPLIAIPFFGDQNFNTRKILDSKIGLSLHVDTMTNWSIVHVLDEILENPMYRNNIKEMSAMIKDEQIKPIDKAVWNIEHLLKFPKAPHFRYHGRDITSLEYYGTIITIVTFPALIITIIACVVHKTYVYFSITKKGNLSVVKEKSL